MKKEKLLNELAVLFDVDVGKINDEFDFMSHGMDSLIVVSILAAVDIYYGIRIQGDEIEKCSTVKDLFNLINIKSDNS